MANEIKQKEHINGIRVRRPRKQKFTFDAGDVYTRVKDFADTWEAGRIDERDDRLQRQAKFRQWTEGKNWPWAESSDIQLPDMTTASLRIQDTLHNAVMSARPPVTARALDKPSNKVAEKIDQVIDHQMFIDMNGENFMADLTDAFVNDGHFVAFIPWVKERAQVSDVSIFPPIPENSLPEEYFQSILRREFAKSDAGVDPEISATNKGLWDYKIKLKDESTADVAFYTDDNDDIEMVVTKFATVFDGPSPRILDWEHVLYPPRAANFQAPGPSNPKGAQAVIFVDTPTLDEITRLHKKGWYDGLTDEDIKALGVAATVHSHDEVDKQTDTFHGVHDFQKNPQPTAESHKLLTRYTIFDRFDIDGDGLDEDVMWWVIRELPGKIAKAALTSEMYPFQIPKRPIASASFIPIRSRIAGIGQLELAEGTHDAMKITYDQMIDANTIANVPFFFYRASSGMRPEVIDLAPGEGYPLSDPNADVNFPQFQNTAGISGLNTIGLLNSIQEKLTMVGDQQLGRVPPGGATALRTVTGMAMLQNNADARPERIMRRFYMGLRDIYTLMHELNTVYLPPNKVIRLSKTRSKEEAPYATIQTRDELRGNFNFDFDANAFNTSRQALQEAMQGMMETYITDVNLQLGIIDQDGIYRLQRDWGKIIGQDPDQYLNAPSPQSNLPKIFFEDAVGFIMQGRKPFGIPAEPGGSVEHLQKLQEFMQSDDFGMLPEGSIATLFMPYAQQVSQRALLEQQQAQLLEATAAGGAPTTGNPPGAPPTTVPPDPNASPTNVQPNQVADQTAPGSGNGTGNPGP